MEHHDDGKTLIENAEEILRRLRGVASVKVEADAQGRLGPIHVLGHSDRSPKLIAMEIASALAAELGVQVDPRQIRVATMRLPTPDGPSGQARLKFVGLTVASLRHAAEVKVHLEDRGLMYEGIASGPNAPRARLDLVAQATLRAVEVFLRVSGMLVLEGAQLVTMGARQVALVTIAISSQDEVVLSGAAVVGDDPREAMVRAVLAAVNRPIAWLAASRS